jgi:hypothetical protein
MATINQSPSGQTSIAISGITFSGVVVGSGDPFREPAVRLQDGGPSVAISFGGPTITTTEALLVGMVSIVNPLGLTEISAVANDPAAVVSVDEDNLALAESSINPLVIATVENGSRLTIVGA